MAPREESEDEGLRYEGPITIDDEHEEDGERGSGRLFVTAAVVFAAVIVIVGGAMFLRDDAGDAATAERPSLEQLAEETDPSAPPVEDATFTGGSREVPVASEEDLAALESSGGVDYRAIPDDPVFGGNEQDAASADTAAEKRASTASGPEPRDVAQAGAPPVTRPRPAPASQTRTPYAGTTRSRDQTQRIEVSGSGADVRALVSSGRVDEAARAGASVLDSAGRDAFALQVLYACDAGNVERAFAKVGDDELLVVPAGASGRSCYRVVYGPYGSRSAALSAKSGVAGYFTNSGSPFPVAVGDLVTR